MIYFDNAATTKPSIQAFDRFRECIDDFGNPSSGHFLGISAEKALNSSRRVIGNIIGGNESEIFFTSGGTEANNLAIYGAYRRGGKTHYITTVTEHPSVLEPYTSLKNDGAEVSFLEVNEKGLVDLDRLLSELREDTRIVSVIHCNNETGIIQDIEKIGRAIKQKNSKTLFHVDSVQSFGKHKINVNKAKIDLLTVSAHKIHGFKGCGALYIREGVNLKPILKGGDQQLKIRPGTENVGGILAFSAVAGFSDCQMEKDFEHVSEIRNIMSFLAKALPDCYINESEPGSQSPYVLNLSFLAVKPEVLLVALSENGICASSGAACSSNKKNHSSISYLGIGAKRAESAIRFSFSRDNTIEEAYKAVDIIKETVKRLRNNKY